MDVLEAIRTRRSVPRLVEPGPDADAVRTLLDAAAHAPDHAQLRPWRFVVVRGEGRERLGELFARAEQEADPDADAGVLEKAASKPLRAPVVIAVICAPVDAGQAWNGKDIPAWEQLAAVAAAAQNLSLAAHAMGFGSMWRTGWVGGAPVVREALDLAPGDTVVGWLYVGTVPDGHVAGPRREVDLDERITEWA